MKTQPLQIVSMKRFPNTDNVCICLSPKIGDINKRVIVEFMIQLLYTDRRLYDTSSFKKHHFHKKCIKYFHKVKCLEAIPLSPIDDWYIEVIVNIDEVKTYRPRDMIELNLKFEPIISVDGNYHNQLCTF